MFLCEVGMNNTLVGLLHPQADEKMFNFSKCSAPSLFLSLSFSLSGYLRVLECVCEYSLARWRLGECCLFAFFCVFTVDLKCMLSITNKRQLAVCLQKKKKKKKKKSPLRTSSHTLHQNARRSLAAALSPAISRNMQMWHKPTWWRQVPSSTAWKGARGVTWTPLWLAQPGLAAHLVDNANYAKQSPNDDDEGA